MADQKVSDLPSLNGADVDAADLLYIIDSSAGSAGSKKITVGQYQLAPVSGGTANGVLYLNASKVATAGSDLVFDGSNLGLGVTPSAWQADWNVYQASRDAAFGGVDGGAVYGFMSVNAYADGSASPSTATWRYQLTGSLASKYEQTSGEHRWFTAGTGTAGNAISFTQAMTLDASGNLGLGITGPAQRLDVRGTTSATIRVGSTGNGGSGDEFGNLEFYWADPDAAEVKAKIYAKNVGNVGPGGGGAADLLFATRPAFGSLDERARITSGGDLLVGTTDSSAISGTGFKVSSGTRPICVRPESTNAQSVWDVYSTGAAAYRFYVALDGTIYATSTTISAISDQRLKENVRDLDDGLGAIMALKPRKFDWKAGKGKDIKDDRGFIAQEFEQVFPDLIDEWKDPAPEGEEPYKAVNADLIPVLVKAIQEQQALITDLRARVAALESA